MKGVVVRASGCGCGAGCGWIGAVGGRVGLALAVRLWARHCISVLSGGGEGGSD